MSLHPDSRRGRKIIEEENGWQENAAKVAVIGKEADAEKLAVGFLFQTNKQTNKTPVSFPPWLPFRPFQQCLQESYERTQTPGFYCNSCPVITYDLNISQLKYLFFNWVVIFSAFQHKQEKLFASVGLSVNMEKHGAGRKMSPAFATCSSIPLQGTFLMFCHWDDCIAQCRLMKNMVCFPITQCNVFRQCYFTRNTMLPHRRKVMLQFHFDSWFVYHHS